MLVPGVNRQLAPHEGKSDRDVSDDSVVSAVSQQFVSEQLCTLTGRC